MSPGCAVCGSNDQLLRCVRCKSAHYCSKAHQRQDWKNHKKVCKEDNSATASTVVLAEQTNGSIPTEGSSENEILSARAESLSLGNLDFGVEQGAMLGGMIDRHRGHQKHYTSLALSDNPQQYLHQSQEDVIDEMSRNVINDMNNYGVCVIDSFLGEERGKLVLGEVLNMYKTKGIFKDGQLVSNRGNGNLKTIRGDEITWIDGKESYCRNVGNLISQVDNVIKRANRMCESGQMGRYNIHGRTKVSYSHESHVREHTRL